jgi:hypothetical protein
MSYKYEGFWRAMETPRDRQVLEEMVRGDWRWRQHAHGRSAGNEASTANFLARAAGAKTEIMPFGDRFCPEEREDIQVVVREPKGSCIPI